MGIVLFIGIAVMVVLGCIVWTQYCDSVKRMGEKEFGEGWEEDIHG